MIAGFCGSMHSTDGFLKHLLKFGTLPSATAPAPGLTLSAGTSRLIIFSKLFHLLGTSLLALQIPHLLTLCAFINVIFSLTYF